MQRRKERPNVGVKDGCDGCQSAESGISFKETDAQRVRMRLTYIHTYIHTYLHTYPHTYMNIQIYKCISLEQIIAIRDIKARYDATNDGSVRVLQCW